ncbi:apolipoprotein N-acyltransferase [Desulfobotulus sp. H1]|uniref:Apolipoprotein N-acyltransferase n=1 Tax=Desulfobotulus pelophilus TaxID=2823377 RepID=A0ABT3N9T3_9BACT|nr:apolipoprotein N-acyltransferase [Desulfobotulus pelophilus]MCW7754223.1 apolipoprotein N-acyltransferase [Desulfobotulus pelophilus]
MTDFSGFAIKYLHHPYALRLSLALLLASGLAGLSLPSGPLIWLPLAALVPFFMALRGCQPARGYALGWAGGSLFWLISTFWIYSGCRELMGWSVPASLTATLLFVLYQGLPYGLAGLVCGIANRYGKTAGPFFTAGIFTLFIAIWPGLCPGSPAISLYTWTRIIQIADIGGMHFVLFFMFLSNVFLAEILSPSPFKEKIRYCTIFILLLCLVLGYGSLRLNQLKTLATSHTESRISVRTIQPNIPFRTDPLNQNPLKSNHRIMGQLTEESSQHLAPPDLILWPEGPGTPACDNLDMKVLARLEKISGSPILFTCTEYIYRLKKQESLINPDGSERLPVIPMRELKAMYNSMALLKNGQIKEFYRKTRLVPFGEATPFGEHLPILRKFIGKPYEFNRGPGPALLSLQDDLQVQPLICFESGFPDISRSGAALGADAFVTVANDGWFVHEKAAELHLGLALFRAVEQRRPMIRATNTGMGAHIAATGEIIEGTKTPMDQTTFRQASLHVPDVQTPYQLMGNIWLWVLTLILIMTRYSSLNKKTGFV